MQPSSSQSARDSPPSGREEGGQRASVGVRSSGSRLRDAVWQWFTSVLDPPEREAVLTVVDKPWCDFLQALARQSAGKEGIFTPVGESHDEGGRAGGIKIKAPHSLLGPAAARRPRPGSAGLRSSRR